MDITLLRSGVPADSFAELLDLYEDKEFDPTLRPTVALLSYWRHPETRLPAFASALGFRLGDSAELHFEYQVPVQRGRGKPSCADLMIQSGGVSVAIEATSAESGYEDVETWLGKPASNNRSAELDGWVDLLNKGAGSSLTPLMVYRLPYQLVHRAASACQPSARQHWLVYHIFGAGSTTSEVYLRDLATLGRLLGAWSSLQIRLVCSELGSSARQVGPRDRWRGGELDVAERTEVMIPGTDTEAVQPTVTASFFVDYLSRLQRFAEGAPEAAVRNLRGALEGEQRVLDTFSPDRADETAREMKEHPVVPRYGDSVFAEAVEDFLVDYDITYGFAVGDLVSTVAADQALSMGQLLARASQDEGTRRLCEGFFWDLWPSDEVRAELLVPPWRERLDTLGVAAICGGFSRMRELHSVLAHGRLPGERFSEVERRLYLETEPLTVRRTNRALSWVQTLSDSIPERNDRAEKLSELWLLYSCPAPLRDYLPLLYRCYVDGYHPEAVILCRSILERAVKDALEGCGVEVPAQMGDRLDLLKRHNVISQQTKRRARDVWLRGNKVIHDAPDLIKDSFATIEETLAVVRSLIVADGSGNEA